MLAVRRKSEVPHGNRWPLAQFLASSGFPEFDLLILQARGGETAAVGTDGKGNHLVLVGLEGSFRLGLGQIPYFDFAVSAARDQELPIRRKDQVADSGVHGPILAFA